jgi:RNase P subunit RPR2
MTTPVATDDLCPRCGTALAYVATRTVTTGETAYVLVVKRCSRCNSAYGQVADTMAAARKLVSASVDVSW